MWRKKAAVATEPVSVVKQINIGQNAISNICRPRWLLVARTFRPPSFCIVPHRVLLMVFYPYYLRAALCWRCNAATSPLFLFLATPLLPLPLTSPLSHLSDFVTFNHPGGNRGWTSGCAVASKQARQADAIAGRLPNGRLCC